MVPMDYEIRQFCKNLLLLAVRATLNKSQLYLQRG